MVQTSKHNTDTSRHWGQVENISKIKSEVKNVNILTPVTKKIEIEGLWHQILLSDFSVK